VSPSRPSAAEKLRLQAELAERRRRERRILALVALAVALLVAGGIGLQAWRANRAPSAVPAPASASASPVAVTNGQPLVFGATDAPVTLRLYEDFHCRHCADFEEEFGPVIEEARSTGQAKVAFSPMAFVDAGSAPAANAMACAAEAGFGPAYYSGLFANATLSWSDAQLLELAAQVTGTVPEQFRSCVTTRRHAGWVESINAAARAAGVTQTPTLFVDDQQADLSALTPDALRAQLAEAARS